MIGRTKQAAKVLTYIRAEGFDVPPVCRVRWIRKMEVSGPDHSTQDISVNGHVYEGIWIGENFAKHPTFVWWVKTRNPSDIDAVYFERFEEKWSIQNPGWNDFRYTSPVFIGELDGWRIVVSKHKSGFTKDEETTRGAH